MNLYLKKVSKADCDLLFNWANEALTRKNSFNSERIKYEEHMKWFEKKIKHKDCFMYIFYENEIPIGQIRVDLCENIGTISYDLDKEYRGKGLSKKMIKLLENEIHDSYIGINKLVGEVKKENLPSQKNFEKLKYLKTERDGNLIYYKYI
ncbi:GNAT family protein [Clostridium sporogenes]|uniref:GNAT family protein n=1 Tax=Clostridium sporogenes TaxID=1509 RepID=A0AAE4JUL0_CLOSG|nr:GNAT family protein [Clostridium sporogenes]MDS1002889.1 GNAT family protein [Clostridium sporogenes]